MVSRRIWLESRHLRRDADGRSALDAFERLDENRKHAILLRGDELAAQSVTLAHTYFVAAVDAASTLGDRFRNRCV